MKRLWILLLLPYALVAHPARDSSRQILSHLSLKGHERVLDLGCGDGTLTAEIAQQVPDGFVLGLDRSEVMIRFAEQAYDLDLIANMQFQLGDARALQYQTKFDIACLFDSFQWIEDQKGTLAGISKGLKSGGRLCLVVPLESKLDRVCQEVLKQDKWRYVVKESEHPNLTKAETIVQLIREAKLAPIHVETEEYPICFPSEEELISWLELNLGEAYGIATNQRASFVEEVAAQFMKTCEEKVCVMRPTLSLVAVKR